MAASVVVLRRRGCPFRVIVGPARSRFWLHRFSGGCWHSVSHACDRLALRFVLCSHGADDLLGPLASLPFFPVDAALEAERRSARRSARRARRSAFVQGINFD